MSSFENYNPGEVYKMGDKEFQVDKPEILNFSDIEDGDRVFIKTQSGNRYMIRHSKSRSGALMVYNEKTSGFKIGKPLYIKENIIAEVGKDFDFITIDEKNKNMGNKSHATEVVEIEIRRGFDDFIEGRTGEKEDYEDFRDLTKKFARALRDGKTDEF